MKPIKATENPLTKFLQENKLSRIDLSVLSGCDTSVVSAALHAKYTHLPAKVLFGIANWAGWDERMRVANEYMAYRESLRRKLMERK